MMKKELISLLLLVLILKVNSQQLTMDSALRIVNEEWFVYEVWKDLASKSGGTYPNPISNIENSEDAKKFHFEIVPVFEFKKEAKDYSIDKSIIDFIKLRENKFSAYILFDDETCGILIMVWNGDNWSKTVLSSFGFYSDSPQKLAYEAVVKLKPENVFFIESLYGLFFEKDGEVMLYNVYDNEIIDFKSYLIKKSEFEFIEDIRYYGQMKDTIK